MFFLIPILYLGLSIFICEWTRRRLQVMNQIPRFILLSFLYSLLFGIVVVGAGCVMMPFPIILAFFSTDVSYLISRVVLPWAVWAFVFFVVILLLDYRKKPR